MTGKELRGRKDPGGPRELGAETRLPVEGLFSRMAVSNQPSEHSRPGNNSRKCFGHEHKVAVALISPGRI